MSGIDSQFSLSRSEIITVEAAFGTWTEYVAFERRSPWLVVELVDSVEAPHRERRVLSRHELTGEVVRHA